MITKEQLQDQSDLKKYYQGLYLDASKELLVLRSDNESLSAKVRKLEKELSANEKKLKNDYSSTIEKLNKRLSDCKAELEKKIHGEVTDVTKESYLDDNLTAIIDAAGPSFDGCAYNIIEHVKTLREFYDKNKSIVG